MNRSKQKLIHKMEVEDDLGIKRIKKSKFAVSFKTYIIIKVALILSIPLIYFIYSPLLILVIAAYIALLFITNAIEKNANAGLRRDLHIHLPRVDSIFCIIVVIVTIAGMIITNSSSNSKKSQFNGMNETEMQDIIKEGDFDNVNFKWISFKNSLKNFTSLLTGTRIFFKTETSFGRGGFNGGFDPENMPEGDPPEKPDNMPDNFNPEDMKPPEMGDMLSNMPFSIMFESILKAINSGILVVIMLMGALSIFRIRKIQKTM